MSHYIKLLLIISISVILTACTKEYKSDLKSKIESTEGTTVFIAETTTARSTSEKESSFEENITEESTKSLQEIIREEMLDVPERMEMDGVVYWDNMHTPEVWIERSGVPYLKPEIYLGLNGWYPRYDTYSRKDAIERGCVVVNSDEGFVYGIDLWETFVNKTENGIPCAIHIVQESPAFYFPDGSSIPAHALLRVVIYDGDFYYGISHEGEDENGPIVYPVARYRYLAYQTTIHNYNKLHSQREDAFLSIYEEVNGKEYKDYINSSQYDLIHYNITPIYSYSWSEEFE